MIPIVSSARLAVLDDPEPASQAYPFQVNIDPTTPPAQQLTMGSTDNTLAIFRFAATNDIEGAMVNAITIFQRVNASSTKYSFGNVKLYQGATLVGSAGVPSVSVASGFPGPGYYWRFLFMHLAVPKNGSVLLTLKGDVYSYPSNGATENSTHVFSIRTSPDPVIDTPEEVVVAQGLASNNPVSFALLSGESAPITIVR